MRKNRFFVILTLIITIVGSVWFGCIIKSDSPSISHKEKSTLTKTQDVGLKREDIGENLSFWLPIIISINIAYIIWWVASIKGKKT